jgi:hypothetical protein
MATMPTMATMTTMPGIKIYSAMFISTALLWVTLRRTIGRLSPALPLARGA